MTCHIQYLSTKRSSSTLITSGPWVSSRTLDEKVLRIKVKLWMLSFEKIWSIKYSHPWSRISIFSSQSWCTIWPRWTLEKHRTNVKDVHESHILKSDYESVNKKLSYGNSWVRIQRYLLYICTQNNIIRYNLWDKNGQTYSGSSNPRLSLQTISSWSPRISLKSSSKMVQIKILLQWLLNRYPKNSKTGLTACPGVPLLPSPP